MRQYLLRACLIIIFVSPSLAQEPDEVQFADAVGPAWVMINPIQRRHELLSLSPGNRYNLCTVPKTGWPRHGPQKNISEFEQPGQDLALTVMQAAAVHLSTENPDFRRGARRAVIHNLRYWAKHRGLSQFKGELHANHFYNLDRTLLPLIVSYAIVRDDPNIRKKDRTAIESWLGKIVLERGPLREIDPRKTSAQNNHSYLRASVTMAWGALQGDKLLFNQGIQTYKRAIGQMLEDASLPLELARGSFSLSYHRHSIASLVAVAEMAALHGIDLYDLANDRGQTLHDLVDYLAKGLQSPGEQDLFFLNRRGHDRHYMAWFEAYRARFPEREAILIIEDVMSGRDSFVHPLLDDYSGAVTSCLFREISR